jgi:hypothetical protein
MNEKLIEQKLNKGVKDKGGLSIKFFSSWFTGMPDRIVLMYGGRIWFVEIKTTGKGLSARQKFVFALLEKMGFKVHVLDTEETLNKFLKLVTT